eukprot:GHVN01077362.1.p1 GENE.GHVN01077362.1~~GHVN01077362.1.p1  ORF type:complete len:336 (+),score=28.90 GHVN01077362.1:223-1230(+)
MSYREHDALVTMAIPKKGRLYDAAAKLLQGAGISYKRQSRLDWAWCDSNVKLPLRLVFLNACDIPKFVADGNVDLGICGIDYVNENEAERHLGGKIAQPILILEKLGFGKCDMCVQIPESSGVVSTSELAGKSIVTSFPNLTRRYFTKDSGECPVSVLTVSGSVEVSVELGLGAAIVDLVETGDTMRAHALKKLETILQTEAVLVCNPALEHYLGLQADLQPSKIKAKGRTVDLIHRRIQSYLVGTQYGYIAYNCKETMLAKVHDVTPGKMGPNISPIHKQQGWVSVKAMVRMSEVHSVMEKIEEFGGTDILLTEITAYRPGDRSIVSGNQELEC